MEEKISIVDLSKIQNPILKELVELGIMTEQGIKVNGVGIIINKLEEINKSVCKVSNALYHLETKVEMIMGKMGIEIKKRF